MQATGAYNPQGWAKSLFPHLEDLAFLWVDKWGMILTTYDTWDDPSKHGDFHLPNGSIPPNPPIFHGKNRNEVMKFITMFLANACRATEVESQRWHSTLPHLVSHKNTNFHDTKIDEKDGRWQCGD